jgi:hypothetical protein
VGVTISCVDDIVCTLVSDRECVLSTHRTVNEFDDVASSLCDAEWDDERNGVTLSFGVFDGVKL